MRTQITGIYVIPLHAFIIISGKKNRKKYVLHEHVEYQILMCPRRL